LRRLYALFFIELGSRRVHLAGCTANSSGAWVTQQARQLAWGLAERSTSVRFLIRDRDSKFTRDFDIVFRSEGIEIVRTPVRAPKANAVAERFVRTVRAECLDWLVILNRRHLERLEDDAQPERGDSKSSFRRDGGSVRDGLNLAQAGGRLSASTWIWRMRSRVRPSRRPISSSVFGSSSSRP
jgi:transposase InsO family protein